MKAVFREYITKLCDSRKRSEQTFIQQALPQKEQEGTRNSKPIPYCSKDGLKLSILANFHNDAKVYFNFTQK